MRILSPLDIIVSEMWRKAVPELRRTGAETSTSETSRYIHV